MIQYHTTPDSPIVEITVEGKITDHELREAIERMRGDLELNGKTRVLERIEHFSGIEPKALWTDMTLGVSVARKVSRAAVVAARLRSLVGAVVVALAMGVITDLITEYLPFNSPWTADIIGSEPGAEIVLVGDSRHLVRLLRCRLSASACIYFCCCLSVFHRLRTKRILPETPGLAGFENGIVT